MNRGGRNSLIECLRFVASLLIATYHFEWLYVLHPVYLQHFYIWVEFFFVISGFFLAKNVEMQEKTDIISPLRYTWREVKKLYPPYLLGFLFSFISSCIYSGWNGKEIILNFWAAKWELFLLQLSGFEEQNIVINGVTGQIAALLVSTLILHYLFSFYNRIFINIGLIAVMFIYSHILRTYGNLSQWLPYEQWFCIGILRAIAGMMVGGISYYIVMKKLKRLKPIVMYCLCLICIIVCSLLIFLRNKLSYSDLLLFIPVFSIIISSTYLMQLNGHVFCKKFLCFLGRISYYIFLVHYPVCKLLQFFLSGRNYAFMLCIYLMFVFLCAYLLMIINEFMTHIIFVKLKKIYR